MILKVKTVFFVLVQQEKIHLIKMNMKELNCNIPRQIAQIAKSNSIKSFFFVSSGYADPKSSGDYLKFKGLVEQEIKNQNFDKIGIMRPSFLIGK